MENLTQYLITTGVTILRYFVFAGIPFLLVYKLYLHKFLKNKIQERTAKNKYFVQEIKHSVKSSFIFGSIGLVFFYSPIRQYTKIYEQISDFPLWWIPTSLFVSLIIHDTYFYWMHRIVHKPGLYKYIHKVHHQSTNPSPWASYSFHVFEAIAEALIVPILLFTIPLHPLSIFIFTLSSFIMNVYGHLGFELVPKWFRNTWLFEVLNTSVYHNMHHSKFKGNYSLYFRVWDRLMNTEHPEYVQQFDAIQEKRFGKPQVSSLEEI